MQADGRNRCCRCIRTERGHRRRRRSGRTAILGRSTRSLRGEWATTLYSGGIGAIVLDNYNGTDSATKNTTTAYTYDSLDRLTQLTDPSNLATTYSYDGLSNATGQQSPDSGTTSRTFDAAGNVLIKTDAKGITATTTYDALNRPLTISYPDSTQNITYAYDETNSITGCSSSYPKGRLTRIIENAVTTVYCYDAWGRVIQKQKITAASTDTTSYSYTAAGRLSGVVYASGTLLSYTRDSNGRIQSVSVTPPGGSASTVVSNVTYQPFGPVASYTLGNGQAIARVVDANYRLTDLTSPAFTLHVARDAMGNITAIGNAAGANPATETYRYDPLYRLTAVTEADGSVLESVTYNPTGDRLSKTGTGLATGAYSYNPNTHQLIATGNAARSVDANGNTTAISQAGSSYGFAYNNRNRMSVAQLAASTVATYTYDALGQRIQKVVNGQAERYVYNEAGQLIGEYGATNRDYLWMDGIPVANVDTANGSSAISYVTADQLGTPRAIADGSGNTIWQLPYQGNPWSEVKPTSSGYTYNLRFAGQYYDQETGLVANGLRTYGSDVGGFNQADPKGQAGGIGLYVYVGANPLGYVDPLGLQRTGEIDPKEAEALNTSETNTTIERLDREREEAARARDTTPYIPPRPASEYGELGQCDAVRPNESEVGPPRDGTGFKGRRGWELFNALYQPVRNSPATIDGTEYSGHALDQMQNRGIPPSVVQNTIDNGESFPGYNNTTGYHDPVNNVTVITNAQNGRVVTVMMGGR